MSVVKVNIRKYGINEEKLDNLACEFNGRVLGAAGNAKSSQIDIEFSDYNIEGAILSAEFLAKEFKIILDNTFLLK